jgi:hypothetical protein
MQTVENGSAAGAPSCDPVYTGRGLTQKTFEKDELRMSCDSNISIWLDEIGGPQLFEINADLYRGG